MKSFYLLFIVIALVFSYVSIVFCSEVTLNSSQPFILENERIVPGRSLKCLVDTKLFDPTKQKIESIELLYSYSDNTKGIVTHKLSINNFYIKSQADDMCLYIPIPTWDRLKFIKQQKGFKGFLVPYNAHLLIHFLSSDNGNHVLRIDIKLPDPKWAGFWGVVIVLLFFILIRLLKPQAISKSEELFEVDESEEKWKDTNKLYKFFLYPLNFAVTPIGGYSISLVQIIFWTFITIFGLVYVHRISEDFLVITPQVLTLLGIGGGTALGAKMNARSNLFNIPSYYLRFVTRKRIPKLKDIISIDGQPNIFKFQMLAFTLIIGCFVIVDILKNYSFPEIPDNMVLMMGISNLIYLGNEVTIKSVWDQIKELKIEIDKYEPFTKLPDKTKSNLENLAKNDSEFGRMLDEMKRLLNSIY